MYAPHRAALRVIGGVCVVLLYTSCARAIGIAGQRIAAEATIAALPDTLRGFYTPHLDAIVERAVEPHAVWRDEERGHAKGDAHHLALDAAAVGQGWPQRLQAAQAFPSQQAAARKLFSTHNVKPGGELPWHLAKLVDDLARAFREGNTRDIVLLSGHVIHFCVDAADPFAATWDRRAEACGNTVLATVAMGDPLYAHQDAGQRIGWELIRRNADRYRDSLSPGDIRFELGVSDVSFAAIECMVASHSRLEALCAADREIMTQLGLPAGSTAVGEAFLQRADEFYPLLDGRCGDICVENLRRAVSLASTLIVSAWTRAGSPDPIAPRAIASTSTAENPPPVEPVVQLERGAAAPPATAFACVASRKAKVYHRPDCSHVQRISESNLVNYASSAEAEAEGKRPCKTCQPGTPQDAGAAGRNAS